MLMKAVLIGISWLASATAHAAPDSTPTGAPPLRCELALSAWCIVEGVHQITRQLAHDSVHDRIWTLRGRFSHSSRMLIFEPNGCRGIYSDGMVLLGFEERFDRGWEKWNRLRVRLDSKGRCDLEILLTPEDGDPFEWAFSEGLNLLWGCRDDRCEGESIAQLKPAIDLRRRRLR